MKKTGLKVITGLTLTIAMLLSCGGFLVADTDPLPSEIVIDDNNFPDAVFRDYISANVDTDGNGSLSSSEIESTTEIDVNGQFYTEKISDLAGIQFFTALRRLYCYDNAITRLDLSNNPNLEVLYCDDNNLTSINITNHPYLYSFGIQGNPNLGSVDITGCQILIDTYLLGSQEIYETRITREYVVENTLVGYMVYDDLLQFTYPDPTTVDEPTFVGHAVQLSGTVGLQFFVRLPKGSDRTDYYMTFTNEHGHISESTTYPLQETYKTSTPDTYMVQINLSSIMMAEKFTPTLHRGESSWPGAEYSLEDYIIWGNSNLPSGSREYKVVRALADYCYYAQPYLSRINEWDNDGSRYTRIETHYTDDYDFSYIIYGDEDYAIQVNNLSGSGISAVNYSLRFGDTLSIRVYLTPASASAPIDGDRITVTGVVGTEGFVVNKSQSGERFAVTISNIPASHLHMPFTITYGDATIVVSPMSYIYGMLTSTSTDIQDDARMLVSALYYYEDALHS